MSAQVIDFMPVKTARTSATPVFYSKKCPSRRRQAFLAPEKGRRARDERFWLQKTVPAPATGILRSEK